MNTSVLVVEDNEDHAHLICELLRQSDDPVFDPKRVVNLTEALKLSQSQTFQVVLLDLGLPESQGLETLESFRLRIPSAAVVVLTAQEDRDLAQAAMKHGIQDYLYKTELTGSTLCRSLRYALERKRFQVSLALKNEELETFIRSASHDLKAPLRHMRSFAQLVRTRAGSRLEPKEVQYLERIEEAAARMESLLTALRTFGEVGAAALEPAPLKLGEVVRQVVESLPPRQRDSVTILDLPTIKADPRLITLVIKNLVENGLKYGGEQVQVEVRYQPRSRTVEVADNGPGIDRDVMGRIFEPGRRGVGSDIPGSGFGLSIARRIVEAHGERLWAENQSEGGAVFCFTVSLSGF